MYQYDDPTCAPTLPTPAAPGTPGFFTDGNPAGGEAATELRSDFMNMLMLEALNIVETAGETPSKTTYNQVLTALKSMFSPVVGTIRNGRMFVQTVSASGAYTADEVVVESVLGGQTFRVASIHQAINLASVGANGMDVGTAPVNGFVGIYLIYNPTTQVSALLATNAAALLGNVYGGTHMPAGFTASALIAVLATNASSLMKPFLLRDRRVSITSSTALTTATPAAGPVALSIASIVPLNAVSVGGGIGLNSATSGQLAGSVASEAVSQIGQQGESGTGTNMSSNFEVDLSVAQFIYYTFSGGTSPQYVITISFYRF
jgi:hypothetical protein